MTKILAKTTGATLVALSGDFLDSYKYRIIEFDNRVRDWNNRKLLDIKMFLEDSVDVSELDSLGLDAFLAKYEKGKKDVKEEKVEEKVEEKAEEKVEEVKEEEKVEVEEPKRKKSRRE